MCSVVDSPFILVLENILSHLGQEIQYELIKYRSVCHQWNEEIVRLLTKSKTSFQIPLRYGPQVPKILHKSNAQEEARFFLENAMKILSGSFTTVSLQFNSVLVDRDFSFTGVTEERTEFLETHGDSTKHLKFNIRPGKMPGEFENQVIDCEIIVSVENLTTAFALTSNLESFDICIRYSHYLTPRASEFVYNF